MQTPWKRSQFRWPITLSAALITLNTTLMICWIVLFVRLESPGALTIGVVAFALILVGLSFWLALSIKEIRLNHRQANFVDSVTHELKSPIAALRLALETLRMRTLDHAKRDEFHALMEKELHRLDGLINQLLEVGRLDAIGQHEQPEDVLLEPLIRRHVRIACGHHHRDEFATFSLELAPAVIPGRRLLLEMIFSNLIDNAVKYAGTPPRVSIRVFAAGRGKIRTLLENNGPGVAPEDRKKIFTIFYRGGSELQRRKRGTGLGLYIVAVLVRQLKGRVSVCDRNDGGSGCVFVLDLPGHVLATAPAEPDTPAVPAPFPVAPAADRPREAS
jgi:signal transduction histidine kinase